LKILHTSDLHFNGFKWIESQQHKYDIFCISGDFLDSSKDETLTEQIVWITQWIKNFKKPLFTCSGNHDFGDDYNEGWLSSIDTDNYYSDNSIKTIENIKFGCIPYFYMDEYDEFEKCDVIITHEPPSNTKTSIDENGKDWGNRDLSSALKYKILKPKIILCGHIHKPISTFDRLDEIKIYNTGVGDNLEIPNYHIVEL